MVEDQEHSLCRVIPAETTIRAWTDLAVGKFDMSVLISIH